MATEPRLAAPSQESEPPPRLKLPPPVLMDPPSVETDPPVPAVPPAIRSEPPRVSTLPPPVFRAPPLRYTAALNRLFSWPLPTTHSPRPARVSPASGAMAVSRRASTTPRGLVPACQLRGRGGGGRKRGVGRQASSSRARRASGCHSPPLAAALPGSACPGCSPTPHSVPAPAHRQRHSRRHVDAGGRRDRDGLGGRQRAAERCGAAQGHIRGSCDRSVQGHGTGGGHGALQGCGAGHPQVGGLRQWVRAAAWCFVCCLCWRGPPARSSLRSGPTPPRPGRTHTNSFAATPLV